MLGHYYPGQAYPGQAGLATSVVVDDATVYVFVGGADRTLNIRHSSLEIEDVLNDEPNRCTFTCVGFTPVEGQAVVVYRPLTGALEFVGQIMSSQQFYESIAANVAYFVTCTDYAWKLDRRLVTKKWTSTSATTIAQEIISGFTTGFTSTNVVAALATINEFICEEELPSRALRRLCAEIGANYYVDYNLDLHLFITEAAAAPDDISDATLATTTARGLAHTGDLTQERTRIRASGGGQPSLEHIITTLTSIPLGDATMFASDGGQVRTHRGPNVGVPYTGKHDGGVPAVVLGNVAAPGSAPTAALTASVVGVLQGAYQYKVAYGNDQGETTPSSASGAVTGVAFTPPTTASVAASGVLGPLVGVYLYVLTYVTALGETSAGSSFGRTAVATAAPSTAGIGAGSTIGKLIGTYGYRVTFVTPFGETEGGTTFSRAAVATTAGATPSISAVSSTMGRLIGAYGYKITTVDAYGESAAGTQGTRTANAQTGPTTPTCTGTTIGPLLGVYYYKIAFVGYDARESIGSAQGYTAVQTTAATPNAVGTSGGGLFGRARVAWKHQTFGESVWSAYDAYDANSPGTVTATSLPSGCTWAYFFTGPFSGGGEATAPYLRGAVEYSTTGAQSIDDAYGYIAGAALGTMGQNCALTSIPTGPTGTVARRIYRTKVGAGSSGTYYLVGEIGDNSTTTFDDVVPDSSLTVQAPLQNLNGEQHALTGIAAGATGTTKRRIYRTKAGGSIYYLLDEILDNSTTTYTDNIADTGLNLGVTAPSASTSGDQHALSSIPTGPSGTIARKIYRTLAGGSIYYLLTTLADNVTLTYTDNKADTELGAESAPTTTTAGGQVHALTGIPTGPTGTLARRIYRTIAGGSAYRFVGELTDNVATTLTDTLADAALSQYVPLVNTAGANKITVSAIPIGGTGVTKRLIYRTEAGGTVYKYVATLDDNVTTSYVDNIPDSGLGREAVTQSTIGALPGDTSLVLSTVTGWPTAGWAKAGSNLIRWTGISSTTLTGIPGARATTITRSGTTATATTIGAHGYTSGEVITHYGAVQPEYNGSHVITVTGPTTYTFTVVSTATTPATGTILSSAVGAFVSSVPGGSGIMTAPFLSGVSGLTYPIEKGAQVRLYVVRNDTAAQTALAALEGGDGIHEAVIDDTSILTLAQLTAASDAELAAWSSKIRTITFKSRDPKLRAGRTVTLSLGAPTTLSGTFLVQRVISSEFYNAASGLLPMRTVTAAPQRWTFQQVIAQKFRT